ncbi:hypothetical protein [Deinococcus radiophilus]|uniref:hypothetical protein n=1 Tax=Deinococcus radiophilus TaxID=32062 RepID=UPI003606C83C
MPVNMLSATVMRQDHTLPRQTFHISTAVAIRYSTSCKVPSVRPWSSPATVGTATSSGRAIRTARSHSWPCSRSSGATDTGLSCSGNFVMPAFQHT